MRNDLIAWGLQGAIDGVNIHPLFVHFPIALLLASAAFYLLGILLKKEQPLIAGKWALVTGAVASVFTVWTGLKAAGTVPHGSGTHGIMIVHQYFGYGIMGLSVALSLWALISKSNLPQKGRVLFLILTAVLAGIVIQGADFGGRMVFQHGVGVGKKSKIEEGAASGEQEPHEHSGGEHDHH